MQATEKIPWYNLRLSAIIILYFHHLKRIFYPGHQDFFFYTQILRMHYPLYLLYSIPTTSSGTHLLELFYFFFLLSSLSAALPSTSLSLSGPLLWPSLLLCDLLPHCRWRLGATSPTPPHRLKHHRSCPLPPQRWRIGGAGPRRGSPRLRPQAQEHSLHPCVASSVPAGLTAVGPRGRQLLTLGGGARDENENGSFRYFL